MSGDINVIQRTQRIIVDAPSQTVSVINEGPMGPTGPPGIATAAEDIIDTIAGSLVEGDNVDITYDDTANTITIAATVPPGGATTEEAVDAVAAALAAGTHVNATVIYDDTANSISLEIPTVAGDPGEPGGSLLSAFWQYSNTTTAPPGSGQMRTNSPITTLWITEVDTDGYDRSMGLATITDTTTILLRATNGTAANLDITGTPVDNGTYWTIPVSVSSGSVTKGSRTQVSILAAGASGIPNGGSTHQVLAKLSAADAHVGWVTNVPMVVKATEPVAADYGLATIPVGAIWVVMP